MQTPEFRIDGNTLSWRNSPTSSGAITRLPDGTYQATDYTFYNGSRTVVVSKFAAHRRIGRMIERGFLPPDILLNLGW